MKPQTSKHGKYGNPDHGMSDGWVAFWFFVVVGFLLSIIFLK